MFGKLITHAVVSGCNSRWLLFFNLPGSLNFIYDNYD